MRKNVRQILNDERAKSLRNADVKSLQETSQISWQAVQSWEQSDHANANRSHRFDELSVSSQNTHVRLFDLLVQLIWQITKHVILFCLNHHIYRDNMLRVVETQNHSTFLDTAKDRKKTVRWLMKSNLLTQFSLTSECLEWFSSVKTAKSVINDSLNSTHNTSSSLRRTSAQTTRRKRFFVSLRVFLSYIFYINALAWVD
jgi:DNA primase